MTRPVPRDTATVPRPLEVGGPSVAATSSSSRPFGWTLLALAGALLANTVAGPLGTDLIDYRISQSMLNQLVGLEVVTVALVVPALVVAALLALREHPAAPLIAFGPSAYAAYMFVQYVLGPEYDHYSLTVVLHLAITSLAGVCTLWSWSLAASRPVPALSPAGRRGRVLLLSGLALFVLARYLPALAGAFGGASLTAEFEDARTFYWSILLLDLGVVVPGTVLAAWSLGRRRPAGDRALYAVVGWFSLVPPSVAAMALVMLVEDDPHASAGTFTLLAAGSVVFVAAAAWIFAPLLRPGRPGAGRTGP